MADDGHQNMSLWHMNYFELTANQEPPDVGKALYLPPLKIEYRFSLLQKKFTFVKEISICKDVSVPGRDLLPETTFIT